MKWECSYKDMNYINFQLDKDSQILKSQWQHKDFEPKSDVWNILFSTIHVASVLSNRFFCLYPS